MSLSGAFSAPSAFLVTPFRAFAVTAVCGAATDARPLEVQAESPTITIRRASPPVVFGTSDSHINKLPAEIISIVLTYVVGDEWCCNFQKIPPRSVSPVNAMTPLQLGVVCRRWRDIAWATPQLWTSIAVDMGHRALDATHVALFIACIARSGSLPLRIALSMNEVFNRSVDTVVENPHTHAMIASFLISSRRVVDLELKLPEPLLKRVKWSPSDPERPTLERFDLCILEEEHLDHSSERLSVGASWDKLRTITLHGVKFEHMDISWNNLTHVDVRRFSACECLELLQHAAQLTHLVVQDICDLSEEAQNQPYPSEALLTHTQLRYVKFHAYVEDDAAWFLERVGLPALEELELILGIEHDGNPLSLVMPDHFRRTLTSLTRLILKEESSSSDDCHELVEVLRDLPCLEFLDLDLQERDQDYYECFFDSFSCSNKTAGRILLPNLKELRVDFSKEAIERHTIPWDLIPAVFGVFSSDDQGRPASEKFLLQRPLRTLHVKFGLWFSQQATLMSYCIERDVVERLMCLIDAGVVLQIGAYLGLRNRGTSAYVDVLLSSINHYLRLRTDRAIQVRGYSRRH